MLGDAVLYAASRATYSAIENVSRRATWGAIAWTFLLCALVLAIIAAFLVIEPKLGELRALGLIGGACLVAGLCSLSMPWLTDKIESRRRTRSPGATAVAVVDQEAHQAVDYFGAMQVVGAAFLFGLGAARRFRR
jgi:uncharacterized membrane protein YedE/YeeE